METSLCQTKTTFSSSAPRQISYTKDTPSLYTYTSYVQYVWLRNTWTAIPPARHSHSLTVMACRPMSLQQFRQRLKHLLDLAGLPSTSYNMHSLRVGAATSAAREGVSARRIKQLGCWRSQTYLLYIRRQTTTLEHDLHAYTPLTCSLRHHTWLYHHACTLVILWLQALYLILPLYIYAYMAFLFSWLHLMYIPIPMHNCNSVNPHCSALKQVNALLGQDRILWNTGSTGEILGGNLVCLTPNRPQSTRLEPCSIPVQRSQGVSTPRVSQGMQA